MLRIAIIGCGKIADSHASQIQRIKGCDIVAACDREELMARQLYDRFRIRQYFSDLNRMFDQARPDVVHITTPPQSHYSLAEECLNRGCHVYIEKPFTLNVMEAQTLVALAGKKRLKITVGHDDQFRPAARRMRELVYRGYLGDGPHHMESYYCYELGGGYANALLSDKNHWVRSLPGGLLHNIISHGIARISEYFIEEDPTVIACGFISPALKKLGEATLIDELRTIITGKSGATAYFTFSSQMRPSLHQFRIYGRKNGLLLDQDNETLIKLRGARRKSYLEHFVSPLDFSSQYFKGAKTNIGLFLGRGFHMKEGMKNLIEAFYASASTGAPLPISYREILLTARIMDSIFEQLNASRIAPNVTASLSV